MSTKILAPAEARTLYDSLVAANNIFVRDFRVGFLQSHRAAVHHVEFVFTESFTRPNVGIVLRVNDETVATENYANQDDFARAYGLAE